MRFKFTFFLLALNILTFGLILYLNNRAAVSDTSIGGLSAQIGRELIEADKIELRARQLEAPRILERKGSSWTITEPMRWSANYFAINRILNQLQFLEEEASFSVEEMEKTDQTLADYGLDDPILTLVIYEGTESISLSIGTVTEIGNNYYLLGPDKKDVFVVNRQVIDALWLDLNDLRTREIFDIPVFEVDALGVQIRSEARADESYLKVRLARNGSEWSFESPLTAKADPTLVSNTINTLTAAKVGRFVEPEAIDPILQGLENPFMRVTIHGNKRRQTLLLGNSDSSVTNGAPHYFAKLEDNPAVFTVAARPFDELREAQEALRERNFMNFDEAALSAINISENGRQIRLQKLETSDKDWQVLESKGETEIQPHRVDPNIMQQLIEDLSTLRASGFAVDAPTPTETESYGFNTPRRTVQLSFQDNEVLTLTLAHPENENEALYARTNRAAYIYEMERRPTINMLPLNTAYYRNRMLDALPSAASISDIKLTHIPSGKVILDYKVDKQSWTEVLTDVAEAEHILTLLSYIRNFSVKNYRLDRFETSYPVDETKSLPWIYRLDASIQLPTGDDTNRIETRSYVFTKRLSGTIQMGGSERQNSIFEISQQLIDALYELTDDMELPPEAEGEPVLDPKQIPPVDIE